MTSALQATSHENEHSMLAQCSTAPKDVQRRSFSKVQEDLRVRIRRQQESPFMKKKRLELPTNMDVPEEMAISTFKHDEIVSLFRTALPLLQSM